MKIGKKNTECGRKKKRDERKKKRLEGCQATIGFQGFILY